MVGAWLTFLSPHFFLLLVMRMAKKSVGFQDLLQGRFRRMGSTHRARHRQRPYPGGVQHVRLLAVLLVGQVPGGRGGKLLSLFFFFLHFIIALRRMAPLILSPIASMRATVGRHTAGEGAYRKTGAATAAHCPHRARHLHQLYDVEMKVLTICWLMFHYLTLVLFLHA